MGHDQRHFFVPEENLELTLVLQTHRWNKRRINKGLISFPFLNLMSMAEPTSDQCKAVYFLNNNQETLTEGISTVDLLIIAAWFVEKLNIFNIRMN
jgi:hypothetical protein